MNRTGVVAAVVLAVAWLASVDPVSAQTRCPEDVYDELLAARPAGAEDDPDEPPGLDRLRDSSGDEGEVGCARIGGSAVLAGVRIVHPPRDDDDDEDEADEGDAPADPDAPRADDLWLRLTTVSGVLDVRLDALLRPFDEEVGWVDYVTVELDRMRGVDGFVRVRVIARFGEDYGSTNETRLLVDVRAAPRVVYAGPASSEHSSLGYCVRGRVVRWTIVDGFLRVRTRVYVLLLEENRPDDPELETSLREGCTRPRAFRADVELE